MKIHVSEAVAPLLADNPDLNLIERTEDLPIKGLENLKTYWVEN